MQQWAAPLFGAVWSSFPEPLATLFPDLWADDKPVKNWKAGALVECPHLEACLE
jgi:hypothetical protein